MKRPAARAGRRRPDIGARWPMGQLRNLTFVLLKADVFREEIKQGANACGKRAALADIDGIELLDIAGIEFFQHGNEPTGSDIGTHGEFCHAGKAGA